MTEVNPKALSFGFVQKVTSIPSITFMTFALSLSYSLLNPADIQVPASNYGEPAIILNLLLRAIAVGVFIDESFIP